MARAGISLALLALLLAGCMHATSSAAVRTVSPSRLDYVVYASMADASSPLAMASYGDPLPASEVAVQLQ